MEKENAKIYPQDYSDEEILKTIDQYADGLKKNLRAQTGVVGPSFFNSMLYLSYYEINKRNQERFLQQVKRLNEENEKSGKISYRLNIITIVLAVTSVILSIVTLFYEK